MNIHAQKAWMFLCTKLLVHPSGWVISFYGTSNQGIPFSVIRLTNEVRHSNDAHMPNPNFNRIHD